MASLPKAETISERVREGLDIEHLRNTYQLSCYTMGGRSEMTGLGGNIAGEFPDFPDQIVKSLEIGVSRRILNNQFIGMSRVLYSAPVPKFPQLRSELAEIRTQFFLERFRGDGSTDGEWQSEIERAWQDGDGLGLGMVQIGTVICPESKKPRVTIKHVKAWNWVYDRHKNDPAKAEWCCIAHYLRPEEAIALYGEEAEQYVVTLFDTYNHGFKVVKALEYWDLGIAKEKPCHAIMLGSLSTPPVLMEENKYGCLPIAVYIHQQPNNRRRPTGRIELQMPIHEDINDIERKMRYVHKQYPLDIVDYDALDPDDLRMNAAGNPNIKVKLLSKDKRASDVIARIPGLDIQQGEMERMNLLERELTTASGITDADRGNLNETQRTATENTLIDSRSQVQGSWSKRATILFYKRMIYRVFKVAALYDRDPVVVDFQGHQILINNPKQPASFISEYLKDKSRIEIDEDAMDYRDVKAERLQSLQLFQQAYGPLLQLGTIDPIWYSKRVVEIMAEEDPNKIIRQPQQQQDPQQLEAAQKERASIRELLNYKDAPPSIQAQMEQAAGFQPAPEHERYLAQPAQQAMTEHLSQLQQPPQQQAA